MNSTVDEITQSTGRLSLFEYNTDELKQLIAQYPFFAPAKFLLAKKMKENNSFLFEEQVQKASIYFQNPAWFDHLLNDATRTQEYTPAQRQEDVFAATTEIETPATQEEVVDQTPTEEDIVVPEPGPEQTDQPELSVELPKFKFEPVDPSKAELTFEPYHTVDYFASQGIKAKEEEDKPKDRLTRQLKSFTEWIKAMKRLPESEIAATMNVTDEKKVEKMAEVSIHDREVVTEAMAEVWEKQGNAAKATEIYQKLSLLNPGKSSYFATKIEQLKNL